MPFQDQRKSHTETLQPQQAQLIVKTDTKWFSVQCTTSVNYFALSKSKGCCIVIKFKVHVKTCLIFHIQFYIANLHKLDLLCIVQRLFGDLDEVLALQQNPDKKILQQNHEINIGDGDDVGDNDNNDDGVIDDDNGDDDDDDDDDDGHGHGDNGDDGDGVNDDNGDSDDGVNDDDMVVMIIMMMVMIMIMMIK